MPDYGYTVSAFSLVKPILRARNAHVHRSPFLAESWLPPDRLSASSQSMAGSRLGMGRRWMELTLILCFGSAYRTRIFTCWAARHVWRSKPDYLKKTIGNQALEHHFFKKNGSSAETYEIFMYDQTPRHCWHYAESANQKSPWSAHLTDQGLQHIISKTYWIYWQNTVQWT